MKNKSIITIILLVSIVIGYTVYKNQGHPVNKNVIVSCNNINTEDVYLKVKNTESKISSYSSSTKDVMGQSTEGGEQTDYMSNGERVLVKQIFFGETGKSEASYYLEGGIVFYIKKENTEYLYPLSEDPRANIKSVEIKDFLLDKDQELCFWYKDKELQPIDSDARDLVRYLIGGI